MPRRGKVPGWSQKVKNMDLEHSIEAAAALISRAQNAVAFTGAGVSEESGIPTFRDPGGIWDRYVPGDMGSGVFSGLMGGTPSTGTMSSFISEMVDCLEKAYPNPGHLALKELEDIGVLRSVITQNIDNLHVEAGNSRVIEVHGNAYRLACSGCGGRTRLGRDELVSLGREAAGLLDAGRLEEVVRLLSRCWCGGVSRVDVVGFGEAVQDLGTAIREARQSDLFLVLGTSGVVWPAASLPLEAKKAGAALVEVNATGCCFSEIVDICIEGKAGEVLPLVVSRARQLLEQ